MSLKNMGKRYAGLTDDPERRKAEHGLPAGWHSYGPFGSEKEARLWEESMLQHPGTVGGTGGAGWRYGYVYTITAFSKD
jgi:hypothetical protein